MREWSPIEPEVKGLLDEVGLCAEVWCPPTPLPLPLGMKWMLEEAGRGEDSLEREGDDMAQL